MARQWEHTHVNSWGWTSVQDVNVQPCTPWSVSHVLPRVSCPSLAVFPWLWGTTAPFQDCWSQPPVSLLALCHSFDFKSCPFLSGENTQKVQKNPKPQGRRSALELTSPLIDSCLTVRFGVPCTALPCTDPKFPAPAPVPASPPPWFYSLQNLVHWDNSHSFVEVRT